MKINICLALLFSIGCVACSHQATPPTLFTLMPATGIAFTNSVADTTDLNIMNYRNFYNGGGVAIGDINNDGLPDVFFTANQGPNQLYLNQGQFHFQNISAAAGFANKKQWSTGVVMVDINNDGWLDIYVCNAGSLLDSNLRRNQLFINNHHLGFTDSAAAYGLDNAGYTTQVSFFDYDVDGDLDCFMINNSPISPTSLNLVNNRNLPEALWPVAANMKGGGDHLWRNDGMPYPNNPSHQPTSAHTNKGGFTEVTQQAGIHGSLISFGLGVTVGDVNNDGYPDVYVSNDFYERDYLYINQKNGTFADEAETMLQHTSLASMGADFGDVNNDGYPDIFTTDMLPQDDYRLKTTMAFEDINMYRLKQQNGFYHQFFQNTLQLNNQDGKFADVANLTGINATDWSWGGLLFDADNDGNTDLYVCNGINHDLINQDFIDFYANDVVATMKATGQKQAISQFVAHMPTIHIPNKAYQNNGNLHFADATKSWGFMQPSFSNGAAYADLDNDGDMDLIVNNVNQPAFIYQNNSRQQNSNHYLGFALKGTATNTFAIGTTIKLFANQQVLTRELMPSRGFQSSMDYKIIMGLGKTKTIDSVIIQWPNLTCTHLLHPPIDTVLRVDESKVATLPFIPQKKQTATPFFTPTPMAFDKHQEDDYVDFFEERNIPEMLSREGPKAAVADVDGDGLDDVVIGGTVGHPAQVYVQNAKGQLIKKNQPAFSPFADFEDVAMLLVDVDGDKDADLIMGPGGNNALPNSRPLQLRLFKNDGHGNFALDAAAFPPNNANIGVITANDFDADGDADLFVGGRSLPMQYGPPPRSYLFVNNGHGHFADNTTALCPALANVGMVTSATWASLQSNASKQLVVVGTWMAPQIFAYNGHQFARLKTNLDSLYGWWQTVAAADINADGKQDLLLGNMGNNFYLKPTTTQPIQLFVGDFDQNGILDKILTYTTDGKNKPVFLKQDLETALPFLKKKNLKHAEYATKSIQDLIPEAALAKAQVLHCNYSPSVVAYNGGGNVFKIETLPGMVQASSVNAMVATDVNGDGWLDVVLGGNRFNFMPQLGRLDASQGQLLINNGKGYLQLIDAATCGLQLRGQLRDIAPINLKGRQQLLFLQNDELPILYGVNKTAKK